MSALDTQEGGNHYRTMVIQPVEFIVANEIGFREGNVIKYVTRHRNKNGAEDIKKAMHYLQMILDEYEDSGPKTLTPERVYTAMGGREPNE